MPSVREREDLMRHRTSILECLSRIEQHILHFSEQKKIYLTALKDDEEDLMLLHNMNKVNRNARLSVH